MEYNDIVAGQFLGAGADGRVYQCQNRAVKITRNRREMEICKKLVRHRMKYLVKIYSVQEVATPADDWPWGPAWAVSMELLTKLNPDEERLPDCPKCCRPVTWVREREPEDPTITWSP